MRPFAAELQAFVSNQGARQQAAFAQHLEAVADADHWLTFCRELDHRFHHWREPGDRPAAQMVSVRKAAGQHNGVVARKVGLAVPEDVRLLVKDVVKHVITVPVTPGAREADDGEAHVTVLSAEC